MNWDYFLIEHDVPYPKMEDVHHTWWGIHEVYFLEEGDQVFFYGYIESAVNFVSDVSPEDLLSELELLYKKAVREDDRKLCTIKESELNRLIKAHAYKFNESDDLVDFEEGGDFESLQRVWYTCERCGFEVLEGLVHICQDTD